MPEWLPEVLLAVAAAALLTGIVTWLFPTRYEAAEPAAGRALRAAGTVALILGLMMSAERIWPHSNAATLLAALAAIFIAAVLRRPFGASPERRSR